MPAFFCATCKQRHVDKNPNCCRKEICRQVNHAEINPYLNFQKSPSPESSLRSLRNSCGRLDCSKSTFYQLFGPNFYSSRVPAVSSYFEGSRSVRTSGIQQRTQFSLGADHLTLEGGGGGGWVISGRQEFFFLAKWWAGYFFPL